MAVSPRVCHTVNCGKSNYIIKLGFCTSSPYMRRAVVYTCEETRVSIRVRNTRVLLIYIIGRVYIEHQNVGLEAAILFGKRISSLV